MVRDVDGQLVPRLSPGVRLRYDRHSGAYLLLSPERGLLLSDSAATIARYCDGERRISDVVRELVRAGVPELRAQADTVDLLEQFAARGLIRLRAAS
jgi:pyrroloquinoline quinone biosynthesis protein D